MNKIKDLIRKEIEFIEKIPINENYNILVELIYNRIHINHNKLILTGIGKAGQIANNMASTLTSIGVPSIFLHPTEAQHGDLGIIGINDILILLSNSGETREIIELVELTKKISSDIKIISITGNLEGTLIKKSDLSLYTGKSEELCPLGLAPSISTTLMKIIGDVIITLITEKIGFTKEKYAKFHHSGYLNLKARELI